MIGDFTEAGYRGLIERLLAQGYAARGFAEAEPAERHLILRHDLDLSLAAALPLAEIERDLGVAATYFVLVRAELYNAASAAGEWVLAQLMELGHDIGLHFDAALYPDEEAALNAAAARECALLETITGRSVATISFHRPAQHLLGRAEPLAGRRHAYQPRYFSEMGYCSDSRGAWHHGHPLDHPAVAAGHALQLLTHPVWWSGADAPPKVRLERYLAERVDMLDRELAAQCDVHIPGRKRMSQA